MTFAVWSSDYETGNSLIDAQHQDLFKFLNALADAVEQKASKEVLQTCFEQLNEDIYSHFKTEEKLMGESGYEGYFSHRASHDEFRRKMSKIAKKFAADPSYLNLDVCGVIKDLTVSHICERDFQMVKDLG